MKISNPDAVTFTVDVERRTIRGLAVPYGSPAKSGGKAWQFSKGTLTYSDISRVKVFISHDYSRAVGVVTALDDTDEGLYMTARIAKGAAGDEVLDLAQEGVYDGLSVGLGEGGRFKFSGGINHAISAPLNEISVTPMPAFSDARITSVAASAASTQETIMENETPEVVEAPAADFSAIANAITEGFARLGQTPEREVVPAAPGAQFSVKEELPYRFNGGRGAHCFTADVVSASKENDAEAKTRLDRFMAVAFASIATTDVDELNPVETRPELYVPGLHFNRPLWNLVTTGTLDNITAFIVPKFGAKAGLVGDHTQGTEPTEGSASTTSQTITPSALSGKVILNREVVDQGGNPAVDGIIWKEMLEDYYANIENAIAAVLAAANAGGEVNLSTTASDYALVNALKQEFAKLQFVKGGDRFAAFAADPQLYGALVAAKDANNQPLLPMFGPTNSDGSKRASLESVQVGSKTITPAWALDKTVANTELSYLFVPESVHAWISAPKRLDFEYKVANVELGIWGYKAAAVTRATDVIPFDMTSLDA